ncbi:Equilibrative Nucleoside Transporter [Blattamonas nauphoetae]|uniref:Equilibrative Nucleoside Transporter n=1 Tax=Blattamonas nauphoetae TaxID=2049346 RepID=A0ABQ9X7F8_9EUKA|nr:Equilibrative Nucleoside Transporter [Blattamonas nauphoetae]
MGKLADNENKDKFNLIYIFFIVFGVASLSAWNSIISAADYFSKRLPTPHAMNLLLIIYNVGVLPSMIITNVFHAAISLLAFTRASFIAFTLLMICVPFVCSYLANTWTAMVLMMLIAFVCGIFVGFMNVTLFGLGGMFAGKQSIAILIGQGFCGLLCLIPLILHCAIPGDNTNTVGLIFFIFSACINLVATIMTFIFPHLPFVKYTFRINKEAKDQFTQQMIEVPTDGTTGAVDSADSESALDKSESSVETKPVEQQDQQPNEPTNQNQVPTSKCEAIKQFLKEMVRVGKMVKWWALALMISMFSTLLFYPSAYLAIPAPKYFSTAWQLTLWTHLRLTIFNICDVVSRFVAMCCFFYKTSRVAMIVSLLRIVWSVLFFVANWIPAFQLLPVYVILFVVFALVHGYHMSVMMGVAADAEKVPLKDRSAVGSFLSISLNIGLALGCILALPLGYSYQ